MKCPSCQSENREGVKFCENCGAKLELQCPACTAKIPLGKKFCGECGQKLGNAIDIFKECGADGWVERYDKKLASLQ